MEWLVALFSNVEISVALVLIALGIIAFVLSTISGGGGALLLVPALNWVIGVSHTAPVLNLGTAIGRPSRLIIFWKYINWKVCLYYAPAAIVGAWMGAWIFQNFKIEWLQIVVGLFLISTIWQYKFGKKEKSFEVQLWFFIPLGFIISILGTIIGALGPILNPFYLNLGLSKEELIATKTANSFLMGLSQIGGYAFFGSLYEQYWLYGMALGIGAIIGNLIGKRFLSRIKNRTFRILMIALMVVSGILLIYGQLEKFLLP